MIAIKELILSIPDIGQEEGRLLAAEVSQKLAARLPDGWTDRYIDQISIRLDHTTGIGRHQLADRIAEAIWKDIERQMMK